jgi:hypothetical protein
MNQEIEIVIPMSDGRSMAKYNPVSIIRGKITNKPVLAYSHVE